MQQVVLVNEKDESIGIMEKMEVHEKGLLHRAFSVFIFNRKGDMLLQQRANNKYHSGGLWTNACCSHPLPGENIIDAAQRRLQEELGFTVMLKPILSFIYQAKLDKGLTEYEFDHVLIGSYDGTITPVEDEVQDYVYRSIEAIKADLIAAGDTYTTWFKIALPEVEAYLLRGKAGASGCKIKNKLNSRK